MFDKITEFMDTVVDADGKISRTTSFKMIRDGIIATLPIIVVASSDF